MNAILPLDVVVIFDADKSAHPVSRRSFCEGEPLSGSTCTCHRLPFHFHSSEGIWDRSATVNTRFPLGDQHRHPIPDEQVRIFGEGKLDSDTRVFGGPPAAGWISM